MFFIRWTGLSPREMTAGPLGLVMYTSFEVRLKSSPVRNRPKKANLRLRPNSGFPRVILQPQSASRTVRVIGGARFGISVVDQAFNKRQLPGSFRRRLGSKS